MMFVNYEAVKIKITDSLQSTISAIALKLDFY